MKYEDLIDQPGEWIDRLESFAGATGVNQEVMRRKINTFSGPIERGMSPTGYIEPQPLTDAEAEALRCGAEKALEITGYTDDPKQGGSESSMAPRNKVA